MNTTNNTESTVSTPPLSKTPVFQPLSIDGRGGATIAFLAAIVIVLCAMVCCSPEDLWNAGWHVGYYGSILLWCLALTVPVVAFIATSPLTIGRAAVKVRDMLPALPTGNRSELAPGLSIAPDDLIRFDSDDETPEQFAAKIKTALHTKGRHYLFIFPRFKSDCVIVRTPDPVTGEVAEEAATRFTLPWVKTDDWQTPASDLENEPWEGYEIALRNAVAGYRTWAPADKMRQAQPGSKALALAEAMTRTAQVFAFVLLSAFTLQAQPKSAQVAQYVGPENYAKKRLNFDTNIVRFHFAKFTIERPAKRRTFAEILPDQRTYNDADNYGPLQKITVSWQLFPRVKAQATLPDPATATRKEMADFMRSSTRYASAADTTKVPTMPSFESLAADSMTIAGNMNAATQKVERWKRAGWAAALPVWKFFMYLFGSVFGILLCLGGLCWYVADSATDETYIGYRGQTYTGKLARSAHESAAGWLLLITWTCFIVLLINVFLWLVYAGLDMWLVVVLWFIVLWISSKITKKIVPNIKRLSGETGVQRA